MNLAGINTILLLIVLAVVIFTATKTTQAQKLEAGKTLDELVAEITSAANGLNYISETDSEVVAWYRTRPVEELSVAEFRRVARIPPLAPIEERTFDSFFTRLITYDETGRWEQMRELLETNLTQTKVFRVQRAAPYATNFDYYAVGLFEGKIVGIQTFAIET